LKVIKGDKKSPNTDILAGEVEGDFDEIAKLPARLERYSKAHQRARINLAHVIERVKSSNPENVIFVHDAVSFDPFISHLQKVSHRMSNCGNYLGFRHYYTVGKVRLTAACFCKAHLLCPLCAIRRGSKMVETLVERYNHIVKTNPPGLKMSMITLTVKNGEDLSERHEHLKKSFQRILKRRRDFIDKGRGNTEFSKIEGLFGSYEVTKPSDWHPHMHLIVLHRQRISAAALKREWLDITGDSHVLRIDSCRHPEDPAQDFLEVCKYALKFADLTPEDNLEAYEALHGKRLVVSSGLFFGLEIPEELTDLPLDELPYFELFYQYLSGIGYSLTQSPIDSTIYPKRTILTVPIEHRKKQKSITMKDHFRSLKKSR
jgi:hypothetical protein